MSNRNTGRLFRRTPDRRVDDMIRDPQRYFQAARDEARRQIERELEAAARERAARDQGHHRERASA